MLAFEANLAKPVSEALRLRPAVSVAVSVPQKELGDLMPDAEQVLQRGSARPDQVPERLAILVPGEIERRTRAERLRDGVPLDDATLDQLLAAAAAVDLPQGEREPLQSFQRKAG